MTDRSLASGFLMSAQQRRKRWAEAAFWLGVATMVATALSGFTYSIAIGAFIPLPFSLAAVLNPSRFNIVLALASWGCWFTALWYILT